MMIGKAGAELDQAQLGTLCHERKAEHGRAIRAKVISKLDEIARNCGPNSDEEDEDVIRPYGVVHVGQAYDVWDHVLGKVTNPSEIGKLAKVCKMFKSILLDKYIQTRLPEVVKLILEKQPDYLLEAETDDFDGYWRKMKAKIRTYVVIRHVSKQTKKSLESIPFSEDFDLTWLTLRSAEQVHRIVETILGNPSYTASFFPTDLIITDEVVLDLGQFHQGIQLLLKLVGHRIVRVVYMSYLELQSELYDRVRTWAAFMPNLKDLRMGQDIWPENDEPVPSLEDVQDFPHMSMLQFYEGGDMYAPYVQRILEASPGMGDLQLHQYKKVSDHSLEALEMAVNLTSLRIHPFHSLLEHRQLPWKLNKLEFCRTFLTSNDNGGQRTTIPSRQLFAFLKQFEETLESLQLERIDVTNSSGYLELKNLKNLEMELHESFENLNFLLYAKKLETLHVKVGDKFMAQLPPSEKFSRILEGSFLGTSIWEVFPNLKKLKLCTANYFCTRRGVRGEMLEQIRMH